MNSNSLSFTLHDAAERDQVRVVVELDWPVRREKTLGIEVAYACTLVLGLEGIAPREISGFSPIEALAFALASIDSYIRLEHERQPLVWSDGRAYGGDYDIPVLQVIEQYETMANTVFAGLVRLRGATAHWPHR